jgi:hypothetical protein
MKEFTSSLGSKLLHPNDVPNNMGIEEPIEIPCRHGHNCTTLQHIPWNIAWEPPFLVNSQAGRNLAVITVNSKLRSVAAFRRNLHELLSWVDEWRRPNDIIFFLSTLPRTKCSTAGQRLKKSPQDTRMYSTEPLTYDSQSTLVESFNEYARDVLAGEQIMYLDIFNSTMLWRNSRHTENATPDCDPDPLDWWIHFLYSALLDMNISGDRPLQHIA